MANIVTPIANGESKASVKAKLVTIAEAWLGAGAMSGGNTPTTWGAARTILNTIGSFPDINNRELGSSVRSKINTYYNVITDTMQSIVTEASTTPTTTKITLSASQNAIRVWTGAQSVSETHFFLYVSKNGGAVAKIKLYRWSGRILSGAAGDTFAFGTSDGRTLSMTPMIAPAVLETSFPVTGTANGDQAGPPHWSPTVGHITLAAANSAFKLVDDSTSKIVFIREKDPVSGTWSPTRFVRTQAGRDTIVRCSYVEVALATYAGSTLSIAAPTSAVIGGTSVFMHNPFLPTVTGTTRNVTDVATFKAAIAAAVAGDEIVLATGTYALDIPVTKFTFAANHGVGGRIGMEGILIRSATGVAADVVVTGNGTGTNGNWDMVGGLTLASGIKAWTWDAGALTGIQFKVSDGKWEFESFARKGNPAEASLDLFTFECQLAALTMHDFWGSATNGGNDLLNGGGDLGTGTFYQTSHVEFIGMVATTPGTVFQDQCLTTHFGLAVEMYGGTYSDANLNVIAPDSITSSPMYAFFVTAQKGARKSGMVAHSFGCTNNDDTNLDANGVYLFNYLLPTAMGSSSAIFRNQIAVAEHNYLVNGTGLGRGTFDSNSAGTQDKVRYNVFSQFFEGLRWNNSSGAGGTAKSYGNTFIHTPSAGIAISADDVNMLMVMKNNATKGHALGVECSATSMAHVTTDYNTIDPTIDADFVAGAHDIVNADAAMDAFFFPTASGNIDGNGDTTLEDYIGDADPWGYVRIYKSSRVSRGARDIPAIYASADLQPDLF